MRWILVTALLLTACAAEPEPTTTTVDVSGVVDEQIAEETSCDALERMIGYDQDSLDKQAADPDYGMTDEQVSRAEARVTQATQRLDELGC